MSTANARDEKSNAYRIQPSIPVGIVAAIVYTLILLALTVSTDVDYADFFDNAENTYRTVVLPLAGGSVFLVAFLAWARWDMIWRDPGRLPMSRLMKIVPVLFVLLIVARLVGMEWDDVPGDLVVACAIAAVLVGFAEEILFRGIFLRCMRTKGRNEGAAALWTAVAFGLFHLTNLLYGGGIGSFGQVLIAATTGATLYFFRRGFAFIVPAMIAHGVWDFSTFLSNEYSSDASAIFSVVGTILVACLAAVALIGLYRREKDTVVTPAGIITTGS